MHSRTPSSKLNSKPTQATVCGSATFRCIKNNKELVIEETQKFLPFELSNNGEKLDKGFFVRLRQLEGFFKKRSIDSEAGMLQFEAVVKINEILEGDLISYAEIYEAIKVYNQTLKGEFNEKGFWLILDYIYGI